MREAIRESWTATRRRIWSFRQRLGGTDRGLSTALNYVLVLGIVSILVTTLLAGFGGLVADQQESATRAQLEVIGNRVAADLGQVDTLATHATAGNSVAVRTDLPSRVVGASYTLAVTQEYVTPEGRYHYLLTLSTGDSATTITVPFRSSTPVEEVTIHGGPLVLEYDPSISNEVMIRHG